MRPPLAIILLLYFLKPTQSLAFSNCTDTTVRIMTWNILNFPAQGTLADDTAARCPSYRAVIQEANPDILITQENSGSNSIAIFLGSVMNANGNQYSAGTFIDGYDSDNGIFYRTSCFQFISNIPIHTALRDINLFTLVHVTTHDTLRILSCHLKSSSGVVNEGLRKAEVDSLRKITDAFIPGTDFIVCGDFNLYGSNEPAYVRLTEDDSLDGNAIDPVPLSGTWNNPSYSLYHTQSSRVRSFGGGATGGLDDRFDLILMSSSVMQPGRISYVNGSITAVGNDGQHYGDSVNRPPNAAVSQSVADALHNASDHLPVYADFIFSPSIRVPELSPIIDNLHVYPNPSDGEITLSITLHHPENLKISILDLLGKEVMSFDEESVAAGDWVKTIPDATRLKSGDYMIRIFSSNGRAASAVFSVE